MRTSSVNRGNRLTIDQLPALPRHRGVRLRSGFGRGDRSRARGPGCSICRNGSVGKRCRNVGPELLVDRGGDRDIVNTQGGRIHAKMNAVCLDRLTHSRRKRGDRRPVRRAVRARDTVQRHRRPALVVRHRLPDNDVRPVEGIVEDDVLLADNLHDGPASDRRNGDDRVVARGGRNRRGRHNTDRAVARRIVDRVALRIQLRGSVYVGARVGVILLLPEVDSGYVCAKLSILTRHRAACSHGSLRRTARTQETLVEGRLVGSARVATQRSRVILQSVGHRGVESWSRGKPVDRGGELCRSHRLVGIGRGRRLPDRVELSARRAVGRSDRERLDLSPQRVSGRSLLTGGGSLRGVTVLQGSGLEQRVALDAVGESVRKVGGRQVPVEAGIVRPDRSDQARVLVRSRLHVCRNHGEQVSEATRIVLALQGEVRQVLVLPDDVVVPGGLRHHARQHVAQADELLGSLSLERVVRIGLGVGGGRPPIGC